MPVIGSPVIRPFNGTRIAEQVLAAFQHKEAGGGILVWFLKP